MIKVIFYKTILATLTLSIILGPASQLFVSQAKAADSAEDAPDNPPARQSLIAIPNQSKYLYTPLENGDGDQSQMPDDSAPFQELLQTTSKYSDPNSPITFDDLLSDPQNPKIIMSQNDFAAVQVLNCSADIMPNFNEDFSSLYNNLPKEQKSKVDSQIKGSSSFKIPSDYLAYLKSGKEKQNSVERYNNSLQFDQYVWSAKNSYGDDKIKKDWENEAANLKNGKSPSVDLNTLSCVTGLDENRLVDYINNDKASLANKIKESIGSIQIDVRVLNTLVYLTTPKNRGGAGHWRVRVQRILQKNDKSTESDAVIQTLANKTISARCTGDQTAADCGRQQGTTPDLEVEDKNGTQYDAYLQSLTASEDSFIQERNLSAHAEGQAIDISEIDDIRCTKIVKKNIGGTKKYKQPIQPIKLAWQTTDGWDASGGANNFDMMSLLKSAASESVSDLLANFNSNITSYDGDLSQASLDDIIQVLGKSLLSNMLDSQSFNLEGFNVEDTLQKLGSTYVADYLGLPREIFLNQNITDLENIKYIIGRSAIEKKLGLPFGSLQGNNLPEILLSIGEGKLEHEMNLNPGDLKDFVLNKDEIFPLYIGKKVIEKSLSLPKSSWPDTAKDFNNLSGNLNSLRASLIKNNPGQVDNQLNLGAGTTKSFVDGKITSDDFAKIIGQKRLDQTLYGLKYFSINNSAYQLPGPTKDHPEVKDTWQGALSGDPDSLTTIGIYTLARLLAPSTLTPETDLKYDKIRVTENGVTNDINKDEFGRYITREWLRGNLTKTGDECITAPNPNKSIDFNITNQGQIVLNGSSQISNTIPTDPITKSVQYSLISQNREVGSATGTFAVSQDNAITAGFGQFDIQRVFGCATNNSKATFERIGSTMLYTGIANKLLSPEEKAKIDLTNTNPDLKINNSTLSFYVERVTRSQKLIREIKSNWATFSQGTPNVDKTSTAINDLLDKLTNIFSDSDSPQTKAIKIQGMAKNLSAKIDSLKGDIETIKNVGAAKQEINQKIQAINGIISDCNELVKIVSEIMAGSALPSSDSFKLSQISVTGLENAENNFFNTSSSIFGLLSGQIAPKELFIRFGANAAESKLGLPANSLVYLVENYERKGIDGVEAFFQSIGQAKVEQTFALPAFYFQAKNALASMPDFNSDVKSLAQYADKDKLNKAISRYLASESIGTSASALGNLPADITSVSSDQEVQDVLSRMQVDQWPDYNKLVISARDNWSKKQAESIKAMSQTLNVNANTLQGVIDNIKDRNYNDAFKSAESDLLMRLGIGGNYDSLKSGGILAWQKAADMASAIDRKLNLRPGFTKALFVNDNLSSTSLSQDEKNLLENNLKIGKNSLDLYIKLINGEISSSNISKYNDQALGADFVLNNPYSDTSNGSSSCPVSFTVKEGFSINESSLENNTFCYYDSTGRHCFKSTEEAKRYASVHKDQGYGDVIDEIVQKVAPLSQSISADNLKKNLLNFVNNKDQKYAFANNSDQNEQILKALSTNSGADLETLRRLFTRSNPKDTLGNFLLSAGRSAAQSILTTSLFQGMGLNIDPSLFGPEDAYHILNGDLSALYRIGTNSIDQSLNLKSGTVLSVFNAKDQIALNCDLNQIGGSILGELIGLDYFPLKSDGTASFLGNFGESKVEQALSLPRGTFFGSSLKDAIARSKAINIIVAFKIPISETNKIIDDASLVKIFGAGYADRISKTSQVYKAQQVQNYARSTISLSSQALDALNTIEQKAGALIKDQVAIVKSDKTLGKAGKDFYDSLLYTDSLFGIKATSTLDLITEQNGMTPDAYNNLVGNSTGIQLAATKIGEVLGLNQNQSQAAADVVQNINNIFTCQGSLVTVAGQEVCKSGNKVDQWYHQWGNLYNNLDKIFTFQLDEKANLPEGTFQKIVANPEDAGTVLLDIGARKIDQQIGLDSSAKESFSGLYKKLSGAGRKDCLSESLSDQANVQLDLTLHNAEAKLSEVQGQKPTQQQGQNNADYLSSEAYKQWQAALKTALDQVEQAKIDLSEQVNTHYDVCNTASADDSGQSVVDGIIAIAKSAAADKIHDFLLSTTAMQDGKSVSVGVNMPKEDIGELLDGDMRYFEAATISLGANYVMASVDKIRIDNCGDGESECKTALPKDMRVTYDDIKTSIIGPTDIISYQRAAWIDVNGIYSNPEEAKVCDGPDCPTTGSGNFGNNLIDALGRTESAYSTKDVVTSRVDAQYNYSPDNVKATIAALGQSASSNKQAASGACAKSTGQSSGTSYDECLTRYSKDHGDPEGQIDRLQNPQKYYDPDGSSFSAVNNESVDLVRKSIQKASLENLQFKLMDMALWKLDENVYPGMARDLLKGNSETKTASLARYLKTGLSTGHLFGVRFNAVSNVREWAQVVGFARDLLNGDQNAFPKFAGGDGFNFLSNFISQKSGDFLGFQITPDLAKGLLVGIGTGDWGLQSITMDNIVKKTSTTHQTVLPNGKTVDLPTIGGVLTSQVTQSLFSWADKALGLKAGQSFEMFKAGYDVYKTWKIYDEISKAKDIAQLSSSAKQFMDSKKISDLGAGKTAGREAFAAAEAALAYKITSIAVEKLLGNQISSVEDGLGMVPGTLTPLVTVAVYNFVVAPLLGLGPVGWTAAVLTALGGWAFGQKIYYYCTADGYFPEIENPPANNDSTGIGVWGGRVTAKTDMTGLMKKKSMESAQNKARKLIENMLWMQNYSKYNSQAGEPVVPIQVMTGRQEDVDYFDKSRLITSNMCQARLGNSSISCGGICGSATKNGCQGNTRMGIWANPQTVAWTHIGF